MPDPSATSANDPPADTTESNRLLHFRWDLDKTYLKTEFDTVRDLVRTFRQTAEEKTAVPGATTLLQELLRPDSRSDRRRVTFISGSPKQMRAVLTEKLRLDGIEPDAFILKDNLGNLLKLRLRAMRSQVGYKLRALFDSRIGGGEVRELLFGDDAEVDAFIYSLYGDILAGHVDEKRVGRVLRGCRVFGDDIDHIREHVRKLDDSAQVERIFIHLDRRSPPSRFADFGGRVVPIYNYFQAALILFELGMFSDGGLLRVVEAMGRDGYTPLRLANSLQDVVRRGFLSRDQLLHLQSVLQNTHKILDRPASDFEATFTEAVTSLETLEHAPPPLRTDINYVKLADQRRFHVKKVVIPGLRWLNR